MDILRHTHSVFQHDAVHRRKGTASSNLTMIANDDAGLSRKIGHDKAAHSRLVDVRLPADGDPLGMGKFLP